MRGPPKAASPLDAGVYNFLLQYFSEAAESHGTSILDEARRLLISEGVELCKKGHVRFQRLKNAALKDPVEKALDRIRLEHRDQEESEPEADEQLMVVSEADSNKMNQSLRSLWETPATSESPVDLQAQAAAQSALSSAGQPTNNKRDAPQQSTSQSKKKLKSSAVKKSESSVTLEDLGGIDKIIDQVTELIVLPLSQPGIYMHLGTDTPRGVLLHGPPGCGKTMLANALANHLNVPFLSVSAPSVVSGMSGESEKKLRDIFEEAKSLAPCLIFLDEIDAITPKRESAQREMERRIVAQLLTCMDDVSLEKTGGKPVIIIGATNRPDSIDAALRRGGRFDREICMTVPDDESRAAILQTVCKKLRLAGGLESFNFKELARATPGFVGADLHALVSAAGVCAIKRIFKELDSEIDVAALSIENSQLDEMVIDDNSSVPRGSEISHIRHFLEKHPDPLTNQELENLAITFDDFKSAIPTVQPSSLREGFATVPDVTWKDVGAMTYVREELGFAIVEPIKDPESFQSFGISAPSGVLLWGPPGCGKTLLAKAVANESNANFISVRGPELLNKYVGESERAVRQVFVRARASKPCVIFFDELDALVPHRDDSNSESSSRVVNTLLTELDGVGDRKGVYVIAATNRPDMIDSAMLRPGRLDKQLYVELPTAEDRAEILKTVTAKTPLGPDVNLTSIANDARCSNFSGADLAALTREAAVLALRDRIKSGDGSKVTVGEADFVGAFSKVKPSVTDADRKKYHDMQKRLGEGR